jgi:DNA polymerase (family X)
MVNKEIARQFNLLANLMELHGENAFKTKAYANAYLVLRKWDEPLDQMIEAEIDAIPGIGSSVLTKIHEYLSTGKIAAVEKLKGITPEGIQQLLSIKGLGPKKVRQIWDELKVESPAELLYACNENRLVKLSGFGLKTQEDIRQKISYFLESAHQLLFGSCEEELNTWLNTFRKAFPNHRMEWVGEMARLCPIINKLEILVAPAMTADQIHQAGAAVVQENLADSSFMVEVSERFSILIHDTSSDQFNPQWCALTMSPPLWKKIISSKSFVSNTNLDSILRDSGFDELPAECMDMPGIESAKPARWNDLITTSDLKGIIHNHSTWSDGIHSLEEMAVAVRDKGYEYFVICDHSRSAFYANGLSAERVLEQHQEIDALNKKLAPFKIFKGIESDILGDGSLDYEKDILSRFDLIVASVHSNLRMDEAKAMSRLIAAIENPYTRILGHPTGRLLLARQGYPIDHRKVIDACAANHVVIELNANPLRLDMDYQWMDYCMEKNVLVSINPDAHSRSQIDLVKYGVLAARKGGLKKQYCLNALPLAQFEDWIRTSLV